MWWQNLKTNKSSALAENEHATWSLAFSSVIDTLIFEQFNEQTRIAVEVADLWLLNLSQTKPDLWPGNSAENEHQTDSSPDGKWIAYASDLTGKKTVSASLKTEDFAIHAGQEESAVGGGHAVKYGYCVDLQLRQFFSTLGGDCLQLGPLQALVQLILFRELCRRVGTAEFVEQSLFVDDVGCAATNRVLPVSAMARTCRRALTDQVYASPVWGISHLSVLRAGGLSRTLIFFSTVVSGFLDEEKR